MGIPQCGRKFRIIGQFILKPGGKLSGKEMHRGDKCVHMTDPLCRAGEASSTVSVIGVLSRSATSGSLQPHGLWPSRFLCPWASQVVLVVKNLPASAGDRRDMGSLPGSGRSPGD